MQGGRAVSASLTFACVWAVAASIVAMLPMRRQMVPGVALLVIAPGVIGWIGWQHGILWLLIGLAAFLSMFRNPLIYFARRALGLPVRDPRSGRP